MMEITSKIEKFTVIHSVIITHNGKSYDYLVETDKNRNINNIHINHPYFLKKSTRKEMMNKIRDYFKKD